MPLSPFQHGLHGNAARRGGRARAHGDDAHTLPFQCRKPRKQCDRSHRGNGNIHPVIPLRLGALQRQAGLPGALPDKLVERHGRSDIGWRARQRLELRHGGANGGIALGRLPQPVAGVTLRQSALIGLVQCLALVPGVSRSGATILGAMSFGVDRKTAAEFSFFLAVPTLTGATVLQLAKHGEGLTSDQMGLIGIGFVVSFLVAIVVVKAFVAIITRIGFAPFAWYRIVAGTAALIWLGAR